MRIISKFQDYYDHMPRIYGMGEVDNLIVYKRNNELNHTLSDELREKILRVYDNLSFKIRNFYKDAYSVNSKLFVICGKPYLIYKPAYFAHPKYPTSYDVRISDWYLFSSELNKDVFDGVLSTCYFNRDEIKHLDAKKLKMKEEWGEIDLFNQIAKEIKLPIFEINMNNYQVTDNILVKDTPLTSFYAPEILYQKIEEYIMTHLRSNPDLTPIDKVSDTIKIKSKGFDIFKSFRKEKKIKWDLA